MLELMCVSVGKFRVAIPTKGEGGLDDVVSEVFGRAHTFTVVDIESTVNIVRDVKVLENPTVSYKHGAGPIVVKMLIDEGVNIVIAAEFGPGVSTLLDQHTVTRITAKPGTKVAESVKKLFSKVQK
jgi:predicted Fe-Mo cluster-binding NifX family protein